MPAQYGQQIADLLTSDLRRLEEDLGFEPDEGDIDMLCDELERIAERNAQG